MVKKYATQLTDGELEYDNAIETLERNLEPFMGGSKMNEGVLGPPFIHVVFFVSKRHDVWNKHGSV